MNAGNGLMLSIATAPHLTPETWLPLDLSIEQRYINVNRQSVL